MITDKQIEELEAVLAAYKTRPTYDWEADDINQCLDAIPVLLSEVKAARSQRAAVVEECATICDGLAREYEGWAKSHPEENPYSDKSRSRVCRNLAHAIRSLSSAPPQERAEDMAAEAARLAEALEEMESRKDAAYLERNQVVAALASVFPSGIARTAIPGWSEDWHGVVYVDLPTGQQCSWHYHDSHAHLFAHLPPYAGQWDGHTTEQKYERLALLSSALQKTRPLAEGAQQPTPLVDATLPTGVGWAGLPERVASPSSSDLVKALEEELQSAIELTERLNIRLRRCNRSVPSHE